MLKAVIDKREIRSFRLWFRTWFLFSFLIHKESFGLFMFCNSLQPRDHPASSEDFKNKELSLNYISKNILKFGLKAEKWKEVKVLFQGGVVLIKDKNEKKIKKETLKFLLMEKTFFFRLFFWQQFLCRSFLMNLLLKNEEEINKEFNFLYLFKVKKKTSLYFKV